MAVDAKTKATTFSMVAASSADGKVENTFNMAGKYQANLGGYGCSKSCKAVTVATMSGWFPIAETVAAGAAALAASATVATAALMF